MPFLIPDGPLGADAREVILGHPNFVDLASSRLSALPSELVERIGLSDSQKDKQHQVRLAAEVADRYLPADTPPRELFRVESKLMLFQAKLIRGFGSLEHVANKAILDLACGSRVPGEGLYAEPSVGFHPWMSRLIHHLGGHAIGIDIRPQQGEEFEWHQVDLEEADCLKFLEGVSIDAYHCANFYPSSIRPTDQSELEEWNARSQRLGFQLARILKAEAVILDHDQLGVEVLRSRLNP